MEFDNTPLLDEVLLVTIPPVGVVVAERLVDDVPFLVWPLVIDPLLKVALPDDIFAEIKLDDAETVLVDAVLDVDGVATLLLEEALLANVVPRELLLPGEVVLEMLDGVALAVGELAERATAVAEVLLDRLVLFTDRLLNEAELIPVELGVAACTVVE